MLLVLVGLLLFIGAGFSQGTKKQKPKENDFLKTEEERLTKTLSKIEGIGSVHVHLFCERGEETVPIRDEHNDPVLTGGREVAVSYVKAPTVSGVLVITPHADDPKLRADVIAAVCALYDTELDRVAVLRASAVK